MQIKLAVALNDIKHECQYVQSGADAVIFCRHNKPDICIVDIEMPGMNGMDAMEAMREVSPDTVFLALSAYDEFGYVREMFMRGVLDYMLKPVSIADVRTSIEKAIDTRNARRFATESQKQNAFYALLADAEQMECERFVEQVARYAPDAFPYEQFCAMRVLDLRGEPVVQDALVRLCARVLGRQDNWLLLDGHQESLWLIICGEGEMLQEAVKQLMCALLTDESCMQLYMGVSYVGLFGLEGLHTAMIQARLSAIMHLLHEHKRLVRYAPEFGRRKRGLFDQIDLQTCACRDVEQVIKRIRAVCMEGITHEHLQDASAVEMENGYFHILLALHICQEEHSGEVLRTLLSFRTLSQLRAFFLQQVEMVEKERACKAASLVIRASVVYIQENYAHHISMRELSDTHYMNYTYFSELFKKTVGLTLSQFILETRMKQAIRLLRDPAMRMSDIAQAVGYENTKSFTHAFKKYAGVSPKEYTIKSLAGGNLATTKAYV